MIIDLTHDENGHELGRLAVTLKVSIGLPPRQGSNHPSKLDHFRLLRKNAEGGWDEDRTLTARIPRETGPDGKQLPLRRLNILLLDDDVEEVFRTELVQWAATEKRCFGDGRSATRSVTLVPPEAIKDATKTPDGRYVRDWKPCGKLCPDLSSQRCAPTGMLYFMLADAPILGAVCVYTSRSWETISQIQASLKQIRGMAGGRLKGIGLQMVLSPGSSAYVDSSGKKKRAPAFFVHLEFCHENARQIRQALIEQTASYTPAQLMPADPEVRIEQPTEAEQAQMVAAEPNPSDPPDEETIETTAETVDETDDQLEQLIARAAAMGINRAKFEMIAQALGGDVEAVSRFVSRTMDYRGNKTPMWFAQMVMAGRDPWAELKTETEAKKPAQHKQTTAQEDQTKNESSEGGFNW